MGLIQDLKDTIKEKKKVFVLIVIAAIAIGAIYAFIKTPKKPWEPPRNVHREYMGEVLQKLKKGRSAPDLQQGNDALPEAREHQQRGREIAPPPARREELSPQPGRSRYSDF
jgi:hypothetical protein